MVKGFYLSGNRWLLKYADGSEVETTKSPINEYECIGETLGVYPFEDIPVNYEVFELRPQFSKFSITIANDFISDRCPNSFFEIEFPKSFTEYDEFVSTYVVGSETTRISVIDEGEDD